MAPRLSVIVPVHNVDVYLEECLESLAAQTFTDLEVVMVDDGSTDHSAVIAEKFAQGDPRFRLVKQENQGLGAARNAGVREISAESQYLTFVDSDDTLPVDAYRLLIESLDASGSDFASGNVLMLRSAGLSQSAMHKKAFAEDLQRTHISRHHELIADRTAWNKVFRRSFWDKHGFAFPEGVLYEDAPLTIPAHFEADAVDILAAPVYHWRQREAGAPSITQRRTDPAGVRDRMKAIDGVSRFLADHPQYRSHKDWYDETAMATEIPLYLNVLAEADDEFRSIFFTAVNDFMTRVSPTALAAVPARVRLKLHLIGEQRLEELLALHAFEQENADAIPVRGGLRHYAAYPFLKQASLDVPKDVLRLQQELAVRARMYEAKWTDKGLRISGHAYVRNLDASKRHHTFKTVVLQGPGRQPLLFPAKNTYCPAATATSGQTLHNYDWAGFEVTLNPERLKRRGEWQLGDWKVTVGVFSRGKVGRSRIKAGPAGSSPWLPPLQVEEDIRVVFRIEDEHLYLRVEKVQAKVTGHRLVGDDLLLTGTFVGGAPHDTDKAVLRLRHRDARSTAEFPLTTAGDGFEALVRTAVLDEVRVEGEGALNAAASYSDPWLAELVLPGGAVMPILTDPSFPAAQHPRPGVTDSAGRPRALYVAPSATEQLTVCDQVIAPIVDRAEWTPAGLVLLEGVYLAPHDEATELVLRHSGHVEEHAFPVTFEADRFRTEFLPAPTSLAGAIPLREGRWYAFFRPVGSQNENDYAPLRVAAGCHQGLPAEATVNGKAYQLDRRFFDRFLIETMGALRPSDLGAFHQRRLRTESYPAAREKPLRDTVLYDTFSGRQFSDSPRAVFEELLRRDAPVEHIWVVRDQQIELPPGTRSVAVNSEEWYEALATSRYIVANSHQMHWFRRREGQVLVQTWHGTPLKKIAHDIGAVQFADPKYLDKVAEETPNWSFLVSPNRFSTPIFRRAFQFEGEILESGYPRNDLLYAVDPAERIKKIRERIGLPEGKKVVLYAPTWRDDQFYGQGRYKFDFRIELKEAAEALAEDHVLLVRKHSNIVDSVPGAGDGFVFDVSSYPEIAELFLISDVLVTDYSSLMFDFAHTGRPMLFFTYDLDHYRDNLRGFYFDFEERAPGPLIDNSSDLVEAVRDVDRVAEEYREPYAAFRQEFCDLNDGDAASRVIERMFDMAGRSRP
ncbi:CDP-glycerol glycerophosphotransferase family protein [Streptacidiphilus sp. N1-3]|uniref:CDP-glycerol glycerophosphotransferase family protein n=1 Tax=Streptacidiphilus alkalitolerans TaxID=3342712 RepID=A0ABV6X4E5_9ACTN